MTCMGMLLLLCVSLLTTAWGSINIRSESHPRPRTLVVIDDNQVKSTHSQFLKSFLDRGHELTIVNIHQEQLVLTASGNWVTDNLIFLAPEQEDYGGRTKTSEIVEFARQGGSIFVASSTSLSESQRFIAAFFGVDFDDNRVVVVDPSFERNFSESQRQIAATAFGSFPILPVLRATTPNHSTAITGHSGSQILFSGLGLSLPRNSRFVKPILSAPPRAVAPGSQAFVSLGESISLVAASQSLTGARAMFVGSMAMLSDAFAMINPQNAQFASSIAAWVCHDKGYLRSSPLHHTLVKSVSHATTPVPAPIDFSSVAVKEGDLDASVEKSEKGHHGDLEMYRLRDEVYFAVKIEEYDGDSQEWKPYIPHSKHAQNEVLFSLELVDPFHRAPMTASRKVPGVFEIAIPLPDSFGVYTTRVAIEQFAEAGEGLSLLNVEELVAVRPLRHDEYERFVDSAYPYYVSVFAVMTAFFYFSSKFLTMS